MTVIPKVGSFSKRPLPPLPHATVMRRTSNAASGGGGGGRLSKLKKRRRHTGSPTPSSLSAPASGARQPTNSNASGSAHQPSSSSAATQGLTQQTHGHGAAANAGGATLAEDISPVPRRDLAASDLPVIVNRPPSVPLGQQLPSLPPSVALMAPTVNFDNKGGKTPKRRKSNANGRSSSGAATSSTSRKPVASARTRSVGDQIRSIFGLDDQEARQQKEESSSKSAKKHDTSKWGPYTVKDHTVRHPILGKMVIPAITSNPDTSSEESGDRDSATTAGIEFRKSLGINEDEVAFPSTDAALRRKKKRSTSTTKSHYQLGDGLRVPLLALAFPKTDPAKGVVEVAAGQANVDKPDAASTTNHTSKQTDNTTGLSNAGTNHPTSEGLGSIQIISERGATIRDLYDLDEAEVSLGRLGQHERRPYVEKKWLPEPPPEDYDDDEEDDDDCVGVYRYKIILSAEDRQKLASNGLAHYQFGWISDRGRLTSDPYVICKEM